MGMVLGVGLARYGYVCSGFRYSVCTLIEV